MKDIEATIILIKEIFSESKPKRAVFFMNIPINPHIIPAVITYKAYLCFFKSVSFLILFIFEFFNKFRYLAVCNFEVRGKVIGALAKHA